MLGKAEGEEEDWVSDLGFWAGHGVIKHKKGRRGSQFWGEEYEFRMAQEKS